MWTEMSTESILKEVLLTLSNIYPPAHYTPLTENILSQFQLFEAFWSQRGQMSPLVVF